MPTTTVANAIEQWWHCVTQVNMVNMWLWQSFSQLASQFSPLTMRYICICVHVYINWISQSRIFAKFLITCSTTRFAGSCGYLFILQRTRFAEERTSPFTDLICHVKYEVSMWLEWSITRLNVEPLLYIFKYIEKLLREFVTWSKRGLLGKK